MSDPQYEEWAAAVFAATKAIFILHLPWMGVNSGKADTWVGVC